MNLVEEKEAAYMEASAFNRYAKIHREGKLPMMHARRIHVVDDFIIRMMMAS